MKITDSILYVGVTDRAVDLFEGQYRVPEGMSYNSYLIMDEKIAVMDTVDAHFGGEWLANIRSALGERRPDYLVVHHMEPDHSANIANILSVYPELTVVATAAAFKMMRQFFGSEPQSRLIVGDGDTLDLGTHRLTFLTAPMVHWPEVMVSFEATGGVLFSADAFGRFGAPDAKSPWRDEARRYYIGIVGKYGRQVGLLLDRAAALDIRTICPLHGPVLREDLGYYIKLCRTWSSYEPEEEGAVVAYTSVYGNTERAARLIADRMRELGCPNVVLYDLARCDMSAAVADAFRFEKLVLATTTYNSDIFPFMREFISHLTERGFRRRTVGLIENGSWAPRAAKVMRDMLSPSPELEFAAHTVTILSAMTEKNREEIDLLARELCEDYILRRESAEVMTDPAALRNIGYGLYVVTSNDGTRDNGLIVNTVTQLTDSPSRVSVVINKKNYSHDIIKRRGIMNVNCLTVDAPFEIFERFGFHSGRDTDKFAGMETERSANGLAVLKKYVNSQMSLRVVEYIDIGSHGMFICEVTEAHLLSDRETMSYTYYHKNVKPKPAAEGRRGFVCRICGYVYEGETLPPDFICPLCKHGAADFEPIE